MGPWLLALAPLLLVPLVFVAVLRAGPRPAPLARSRLPGEPFATDRCTWHCHNRGCRHAPVLPAWLTGDAGLYGGTIRALQRAGRVLSPRDPRAGYGLANLMVFCVAWPVVTYGLYLVALRQRQRLRRARHGS